MRPGQACHIFNRDSMKIASDGLARLRFSGSRKIPVILQSEQSECGLACLAMVAGYHDYSTDLLQLRRNHRVSGHGTSLRRLIKIAASMRLEARPLRLEVAELERLAVPCILHWNMNHYVVLSSVSPRGLRIVDPARGERLVSWAEASDSFTGVALELTPAADFAPAQESLSVSLGQLTGRVVGFKRSLLHVLVLALAFNLVGLLLPFYSQWVIDDVLNTSDHGLLTLLGVGFLLATLFSALLGALRSWVLLYLNSTLGIQWATNVFAHLMRLPQAFFESRQIGDIVSRAGAIQDIRRILTTNLVSALLDGALAVLNLVIIAIYSPLLTAVVIGIFALYALLRWSAYGPLRDATERKIHVLAKQETFLLESIRSTLSIKLANLQEDRTARYANAIVDSTNHDIRVQQLSAIFSAAQQFLIGAGHIAVYWIAAAMILDRQFTLGMLVAFASYSSQFLNRGDGLIDSLLQFRMLRLYGERLADIALTGPEEERDEIRSGSLPDGPLTLDRIAFRYGDDEPWIVRKASMRIDPGESVAIVGPSGTGKTTLAKLILGLLRPESGAVRYCGIEISSIGYRNYRSRIAAVMQTDQLFSGTIADNIASFSPDVTQEDIERYATQAGIHDEISAMRMGYQTLVGNDGGLRVSEGQKQRLLLARAICHKPSVLLLDEATSQLDVARENQVAQTLDKLEISRIVIAHRPDTIRRCNRVYLLADGMLRELSAHEIDLVTGKAELRQEASAA